MEERILWIGGWIDENMIVLWDKAGGSVQAAVHLSALTSFWAWFMIWVETVLRGGRAGRRAPG